MNFPSCSVMDINCCQLGTETCAVCGKPVCVNKYCSIRTVVPEGAVPGIDGGLHRVCKTCIVESMPGGWAVKAARAMTGKIKTRG